MGVPTPRDKYEYLRILKFLDKKFSIRLVKKVLPAVRVRRERETGTCYRRRRFSFLEMTWYRVSSVDSTSKYTKGIRNPVTQDVSHFLMANSHVIFIRCTYNEGAEGYKFNDIDTSLCRSVWEWLPFAIGRGEEREVNRDYIDAWVEVNCRVNS